MSRIRPYYTLVIPDLYSSQLCSSASCEGCIIHTFLKTKKTKSCSHSRFWQGSVDRESLIVCDLLRSQE